MSSSISFKRPPIDEVVVGRRFLHRPDLLAPHFGLFWARIRDRFPTVQQVAPLQLQNEFVLGDLGSVSPRIWYVSEDEAMLAQLQQNCFFYNWRRKANGAAYVRFPAMLQQSNVLWADLEAVVGDISSRPLQTIGGEVTYVNYIDFPGATTANDIAAAALRDFHWVKGKRFLQQPKSFLRALNFALPDGTGSLEVTLSVVLNNKTKMDALKLELTARGTFNDDTSYDDWLTSAHDFLVAGFKDMTTPELHEHWGLET